MQELLRFLASLKGIPIEPGAELRFELAGFPSGGLGLLVLIGLGLALLFVVSVYRRDGVNLSRGRRLLLAALRCGAVLAVVLLLLEPNLVAVKKEQRPGQTLLLLDVSQSMGHRDAFQSPGAQKLAAAWRKLGIVDPKGATRMELAKALLGHQDSAWLDELGERNRLMLYTFAATAEPMPVLAKAGTEKKTEDGAPHRPRPDLPAISAKGRHSNIGGAMRQALERSRDAAIAGVILLSDGRRNLGPQGSEIARMLLQRKVPHTLILGIGDPSETRTVAVTRIEAPQRVFQRDPFRIKAEIASAGYGPMSLTVKLERLPKEGGEGTVLAGKQVMIGGDAPEMLVEFDQITATEPGVFTYRVSVVPPDGEPLEPERHAKAARVEVLAEKTRVLLISGGPSHEFRFLLHMLKRDRTVEVAGWLCSADTDFPQDGNRTLEALPVDQGEMDQVDLLILMDPDPSKLSRDFCELAAKHVLGNGAGLWWVCSDKYSLAAMRAGASTHALAELLPVVPDLQRADRDIFMLGRAFPRAWRPILTAEGAAHPAARILESRDENLLLWRRLPGFHFAFPVLRKKPAALTLVGHGNPSMRRPAGPMPLLAVQFVGAGRVLFSGSDETYRWRSVFAEAYKRFWIKGIRYLYQGRLNAGNSRFRLYLSEDQIELGESVKVVAEVKDEAYQPLMADSVELSIHRDEQPVGTFHLVKVEAVPGQYETSWRPDRKGFYRLAPVALPGRGVEARLQVKSAAIEKEGPVDEAELSTIAGVPGGELLHTPADLLAAVRRIPSLTTTDVFRTPHPIWDTFLTIGFILLLLSAEWWLRKRFNLL